MTLKINTSHFLRLILFLVLILSIQFINAQNQDQSSPLTPVFQGDLVPATDVQRKMLEEHFQQFQIYQFDTRNFHQWALTQDQQVKFTLQLGRDISWEMEMQPKKIRGDRFEVLSQQNGVLQPVDFPVPLHLEGKANVEGSPSGRMTLQDNFLSSAIRINGKAYYLERLSKYIPGSPENYLVYYSEAGMVKKDLGCGAPEIGPKEQPSDAEPGRNDPPFPDLCLDFLMAADHTFCNTHGNLAVAEIEAIHFLFQDLYDNNTIGLTFALSSIILFTEADPYPASNNIVTILNSFCEWRSTPANNVPPHDLSHLITGIDRSGGTIGIAYVGTTCFEDLSCAVTESIYANAVTAAVVAHEVGHNLSAGHDGASNACDPSGFVMSAGLNVNNLPTNFSTCSKEEFSTFYLQGNMSCAGCNGVECVSPPSAVCQNIEVELGSNQSVEVLASSLNNGSSGCNPLTFEINGEESITFNCDDIGPNNVTLTVTDPMGAIGTCNAVITVSGGDDSDDDGIPDACDACAFAEEDIEHFDYENCNCLPGYYAIEEEVNGEMIITNCQICPPGSFCIDGVQAFCPAGTSQSQEGATSCVPCAPGNYNDVIGAVVCISCPAGTSQSQIGATECIACAPGSYSDQTGAIECTSCPTGTSQSEEGATECVACAPGSYSDQTGATECTSCPAGTSQSEEGATECVACAPGSYSDQTGLEFCISCPAGTSQSLEGATVCIACAPGSYSDQTGATECTSCPAGTSQSENGATECVACAPGSYSDQTGSTFCTSCPAGTSQSEEGATECVACAPGSYSDQTGSTICISCPAGTSQSEEGATECVACAPGSYSDQAGSTVCTACPEGTSQSEAGATECVACVPGSYSNQTGSTVCISCPAGTSQSEEGATECVACAPGSFSNQEGATFCTSCPPGTSQSLAGATSCFNCAAGSYSSEEGSTTCTACPAGTYQSHPGATSCIACEPGYFQDQIGSTTCTACEGGTFQPNSGSTECYNCCDGTSSQPGSTSCDPGEWSPWTECDAECGGGEQTRDRPITTLEDNVVVCDYEMEIAACNTHSCELDCVVSEWSPFSECSEDCNGTKCRTREILVEAQEGGEPCPPLEECVPCNVSEEDSDCDGVPDDCDVCPGGDDSGPCDVNVFPGMNNIPAHFKCGNNKKVKLCHNGFITLCLPVPAVQAHLNHGDFLGPCVSCNDNNGNPGGDNELLDGILTLAVHPNPTNGLVNVHIHGMEEEEGRIVIYDMLGQAVLVRDLAKDTHIMQLDLGSAGIMRGNYVVQVSSSKGLATSFLVYAD